FSSRRRHTRCYRDWSSDVCSSDLGSDGSGVAVREGLKLADAFQASVTFVSVTKAPLPVLGDPYYQRAISEGTHRAQAALTEAMRSEERRVGEETRVRVAPRQRPSE